MADQGSEGLLSPFLRSQRVRAIQPYLRGKILDYGCGSGVLASLVLPENYIGYDRDENVIKIAQKEYPLHNFQTNTVSLKSAFDTIVSLAVIEHVPDPKDYLLELSGYLKPEKNANIICTTPHPSLEIFHTIGARLGIFSRHASEEHQTLLDQMALLKLANECQMQVKNYQRFLFGANQLIVFGLIKS